MHESDKRTLAAKIKALTDELDASNKRISESEVSILIIFEFSELLIRLLERYARSHSTTATRGERA